MGRRDRRKGSQGRAEGRVRERVRGRAGRGGEVSAGRRRGTFDVGAIEGYARLLGNRAGGTSRLAGAASGLAGSNLAHRISGSDTEVSEEDFRKEVTEHLALVDERLQRLEDEVHELREGGGEGDPGDVTEPDVGTDPQSNP